MSAGRFPRVVSGSPPASADVPEAFHLTDAGNAQRLVAEHGEDLRYDHARGVWRTWDGRRWARDTSGEVMRRAKRTARAIFEDAAAAPTRERREVLAKHAVKTESARSLAAMIELAKSEPGIPVDPKELDADPWLLNVQNGVVDLRSGALVPHARELLMTRLAGAAFNPEAQLDVWDRYLEQALPSDELRSFVQRAAGYTLTGLTSEERLFFVHGPPASGKTTFLEAFKAVLGEYATTADFETFLARQHVGGPRPDLAQLVGMRFVASAEVDEGKRLAEGLVKLLTGGDEVSVRDLYQAPFQFVPQFTLWLASNDEPRVRDDDAALWRRILEVPFAVSIPEPERDPRVKDTLCDPRAGAPAILAWAVRGCLAWQREGLSPPGAVISATRAYRDRMDPLAEFLEERCELVEGAWTSTRSIHAAHTEWCRATHRRPLTTMALAKRLAARGLVPQKQGERGWLGILVADRSDTSDRSGGVSGKFAPARARGEVYGNDL